MSTTLSPRATSAITVTGVVVVTGYAVFVAWAANWASYAGWIAMVLLPLLFLASGPMLVRAGRRDPDPRFLKLLVAAFVIKALATVARYLMAFVLYNGVADAKGYDGNGARLAEAYRMGNFSIDIGRDFIGTGFIRVLTGAIYTITGQSIFVAYALFSWFGFWGLYFLYRAFRVALPDCDARRYALLILLLPSMQFWPSSLGKEAWMTLGIGLAAYGSALLLSGDRRWVIPLALGLTATSMVRPHITAALAVALAAAYLLGRSSRPATELTPIIRFFAIVALMIGGYFAVHQAASFLGVSDVSVSSVDGAIDDTADQTSEGDSSFTPEQVNGPADLPVAAVSVLFRPFVFEAGNAQMLIAAAEGSLLMLLFVVSYPRWKAVPGRLRRQPYLLFCGIYTLMFIYAFSNFSNFGILTRERVQVMPFVLVLLALPRPAKPAADTTALPRPGGRVVTDHQGVPT
jgi:hypothetical protein